MSERYGPPGQLAAMATPQMSRQLRHLVRTLLEAQRESSRTMDTNAAMNRASAQVRASGIPTVGSLGWARTVQAAVDAPPRLRREIRAFLRKEHMPRNERRWFNRWLEKRVLDAVIHPEKEIRL